MKLTITEERLRSLIKEEMLNELMVGNQKSLLLQKIEMLPDDGPNTEDICRKVMNYMDGLLGNNKPSTVGGKGKGPLGSYASDF